MQVYGLVGKNISYSFSRSFFAEKFTQMGFPAVYENFDLDNISKLPTVLSRPGLRGFNVTIPYKQAIIPFLARLSSEAENIGAVNTVKVEDDGSLSGHNTDWTGFRDSLVPMLLPGHKSALILGTGGASKAVAFALDDLGIGYRFASRSQGGIPYEQLNRADFQESLIVVNCTPLGTFPDIAATPPLPDDFFTLGDIAFDLVYNPRITRFMEIARSRGAVALNGLRMLEIQANKAWDIWQ